MTDDDSNLYEAQRLIIPPRINKDEPRRVVEVLRMMANDIEALIPMAQKKPQSFLREYLKALVLVRDVTKEAEVGCIRDWTATGSRNVSEIARITGVSRNTVDRRAKEPSNLDRALDQAANHVADKSNQAGKPSSAKTQSKPKREDLATDAAANPYGVSDYEEVN